MKELNKLWAKSNGETIREHTDNLLKAFEQFKRLYGGLFDEKELLAIEYAIEYHDYGKASLLFQKRVGNENALKEVENSTEILKVYAENGFEKNIPHGYLSPAFINLEQLVKTLGNELKYCVITAIYYHHNRKQNIETAPLKNIINADFFPRFGVKNSKYKKDVISDKIDEQLWIAYAVILGMLNKFDYYASDIHNKLEVEIDVKYNGKFFYEYILENFKEKGYSLRPVQQYMLDHQNENVIVTASTGIGKTESAMLWAGKQKLFYTLPLKVSINAMYHRLKSNYGYSNVTLLHSDFVSQLENEFDEEQNLLLKCDATKRLSFPITVCTIDQLFSFVYKYRGCEILLATLRYSKIIIDEIQSYEPSLVAKLIYGLKLITEVGGKFAIITATMPDILLYFIKKEKIDYSMSQKPYLDKTIRHKISYEKSDDFDYEKLKECAIDKKVLVICNTVKRACEVYEKLIDENTNLNVHLLHSKFIRKHRNMLESEIIKFAEDKNSAGIWVTTQLVEASLDIDFDILFTEMCTADSLLQRMGRCYRKRAYNSDDANVIIINNHNGYGKVYYKEIFDRSVEAIQEYDNSYFKEQQKIDYVNYVYDTKQLKGYSKQNNNHGYYNDIKKELDACKGIIPFNFTADEAKSQMRNIISYQVVPEQIYNDNLDEFDKAKEVLNYPKKYNPNEIRWARRFIEDNSISLGIYDLRTKDKCKSVFDKLDYYTLGYKYDFDENTLSGLGLTYYKDEEDNYI